MTLEEALQNYTNNTQQSTSTYLDSIKNKTNIIVDIGASNSPFEKYTQCKCLLIDYAWDNSGHPNNALPISTDNKIYSNAKVTPNNIIEILKQNNIPKVFDFLKIDIDGYDYYVIDKILEHYSPYIICSEINEKIPPPIKFKITYEDDYKGDNTHCYGYSISCLEDILDKYGYDLVQLSYADVFLIKREFNIFDKKTIQAWLNSDNRIVHSKTYITFRNGNSWKFGGILK